MAMVHLKRALATAAMLAAMPAAAQLATKSGGDAVKGSSGGSGGSGSDYATKRGGAPDVPETRKTSTAPAPLATKQTAGTPAPLTTKQSTATPSTATATRKAAPTAASNTPAVPRKAGSGAAPPPPATSIAGLSGPPDLLAKCRAGNAVGCWELGGAWIRGEGVPQDFAKGSVALLRACDLGVAQGCFVVGAIADNAHDTIRAIGLFMRACDGGIGEACNAVGDKYQYGRGVATDRAAAIRMYDHACAYRWGEGCATLADVYGNGNRLVDRKDPRQAMFYADKGCSVGDGYSCSVAGALTLGLSGGSADRDKAEYYNKLGCNFNDATSCMNLGYVFSQRNEWTATRDVYAKACKIGDADACSRLREIDKYLADVATAGSARAQWDAKQAQQRERVDGLLRSGDVNGAMRVAAYDMGSIEQVSRIILLANDAHRLDEIDAIFFEAFETWQLPADAKRISSQEKRKRDIAAREAARAQYYNVPNISYSSNSWGSSSASTSSAWSTPTPSISINSSQIYKDARDNVSRTYCAAGWSHC